jgi:hypothetical protein
MSLPGVRTVEACTAWVGRLCGASFGDQALATRTGVARRFMLQVPILEDVAFMRLARREARLTGGKVAATEHLYFNLLGRVSTANF